MDVLCHGQLFVFAVHSILIRRAAAGLNFNSPGRRRRGLALPRIAVEVSFFG